MFTVMSRKASEFAALRIPSLLRLDTTWCAPKPFRFFGFRSLRSVIERGYQNQDTKLR
jgi:hypothetical protein